MDKIKSAIKSILKSTAKDYNRLYSITDITPQLLNKRAECLITLQTIFRIARESGITLKIEYNKIKDDTLFYDIDNIEVY